jgi:putative addiction module component (TIGR02574 family)
MGLDDLETEALKLNLTERALLAERLFLSLDAPGEEENLRLWVTEAERRLAELRAGDAVEVPSQEVLRRARAAIA